MKRFLLLLCVVLGASPLFAQAGWRYDNMAFVNSGGFGKIIPFAAITVCANGASAGTPTTPCSPAVATYADSNLGQQNTIPALGDADGNFFFYVAAGLYKVSVCNATKCHNLKDVLIGPSGGGGTSIPSQNCNLGGFFNAYDGLGSFTCDFPVVNFFHNGTLVGTEQGYNVVDSPTVIWTVADNPLNNRVDYSIATEPVDVGVTFNGVFDSGYTVIRHPFPFAVTIPAGCTHSRLILDVATTGTLTFSLTKNGVEFGTAAFGAGESSATFTCSTITTFSEGDVLRATATGIDATAADLGGAIYGTR